MEEKLEDNIDSVVQSLDVFKIMSNRAIQEKQKKQGVRLTKKLVLEASMCDELDEIGSLMLRDKNLSVIDDNYENEESQRLRLKEMCNIEVLYASHNLLTNILGICALSTLTELNLSFNAIDDLSGIEELTQLKVLHLNHNKIQSISLLSCIKGLKQLGLFHNEIMESPLNISTLCEMRRLKELSIGGNPCSKIAEFNYEIICRMPQLKMLDEEAVKELDRDVAEQYFVTNEMDIPRPFKDKTHVDYLAKDGELGADFSENMKHVRFQDVMESDEDEMTKEQAKRDMTKFNQKIFDLEAENEALKVKLTKKKYDEVYEENDMLQLQLQSMFAMADENMMLKADLERLKALSWDDRIKSIAEENK